MPADSARLDRLVQAFSRDGYVVDRSAGVVEHNGALGMRAVHRTATTHGSGKPKYALYLEGSHYEMGYLQGLLAEKEISLMTTKFRDQVLFDFIRYESDMPPGMGPNVIQQVVMGIVQSLALARNYYIPEDYMKEMEGIVDGCTQANSRTAVSKDTLIFLNVGMDILLSIIYSGKLPGQFSGRLNLGRLLIPMMCNAFSIFGDAAGGGHFFGRDFMFPTAGIFQDTVCTTIYKPGGGCNFVGVTAPAFIGCVAAMNIQGIACGVNMAPAAACNPNATGMNSLLMVRHCIEHGATGEEAVKRIEESPRGVSWIYVIADGMRDCAYVLETVCSEGNLDVMSFPPRRLTDPALLPDRAFIKEHKTVEIRGGVAVRKNDYAFDEAYLAFNKGLWKNYRKTHPGTKLYHDAFTTKGYINRADKEKNCPATAYFAPLRVGREDVVIATNHFIIPEMRLCGMADWVTTVFGNGVQDSQWRYDELNRQVLDAISRKGFVDAESAGELIDFLAPYRKFPDYYANKGKGRDGEIIIEGSVSLFDLKEKKVKSHYGYYCDEWVELTLPSYL